MQEMNTKAGTRRKDPLTLSSNEKKYHYIFSELQTYQREYGRAARKKERQVKTLQEINSRGSGRVIDDLTRQFDAEWTVTREIYGKKIRSAVYRIKDTGSRKKLQYKCNFAIRCPEKTPTFATEQEFLEWCGVDVPEPP